MKRAPDPTPADIRRGCEHAQRRWSACEELRRRTIGPLDVNSEYQTRLQYLPHMILDRDGRAHFALRPLDL